MNKQKQWSLRTKLVAMSLSTLLVLGATSVGVLQYMIYQQKIDAANAFESFSLTMSDSIAAQFYERYGDVQAFAMNPNIQSSNRKTIIQTFNDYSALYGIYDLIMLVDANGNLIAVNDKDPSGKPLNVDSLYSKNYANADWFKAVMNGEFTSDKENNFSGTYVEDPQLDPYVTEVFGDKRLGSGFSAAVKNAAGKTIGVITNRAGQRWFDVAFKEVYRNMREQDHAHTEIKFFGKDGLVFFEYAPNPTGPIEEVKNDWNRLLKANLVTEGDEEAKLVIAGKADSTLTDEHIHGFGQVRGPKFIDKLGWGIVVESSADEAFHAIHEAEKIFYTGFLIVLCLSIAAVIWFSGTLSKKLVELANSLSRGGVEVASAASQIAESSTKLSEASVEQAAAIQETASAIDEVSAMVKKNSENAAQSKTTSNESRISAETGQESVQRMVRSISEISDSNDRIMAQVGEGNRKISEIVTLISEIGNKTKVINDIVFQTKLLSFNASVEAARAGEHGKGFAVVAEEVGNLAQMSGNAAKEISEMLDGSIQKVETIINETKSSVERLVSEGKSKVEAGKITAAECGRSLEKIIESVHDVDSMVSEIATASNEQSQGVDEINKAMNQLDQVTQENAAVSRSSAESAQQLSAQSQELAAAVDSLFQLVNGKSQEVTQERKPQAQSARNVVQLLSRKKELAAVERMKSMPDSKPTVGSVTKKAVGDSSVPDADDSRFEEI